MGTATSWCIEGFLGLTFVPYIKDAMTVLSYKEILETVMLAYASENMPLIWPLQ